MSAGSEQFAVFRIGERLIGAQIAHVAEVCSVESLSPMLATTPGLLGALNLRGRMIPIYDIDAVLSPGTTHGETKLAVILQTEDRMYGVRMDRMEGFSSPREDGLQSIDATDHAPGIPATGIPAGLPGDPPHETPDSRTDRGPGGARKDPRTEVSGHAPADAPDSKAADQADMRFEGAQSGAGARRVPLTPGSGTEAAGLTCFLHGSDIVSVIDPGALAGENGLETAARPQAKHASRTGAVRIPHLLCTIGAGRIAIDARAIQNTIPRRPVDEGALSVGNCLGSVTHDGHRIPVMHTGALLGLGAAAPADRPEIVILKQGDSLPIGLAVDSIDSMWSLSEDQHGPSPRTFGALRALLPEVFLDDRGAQVFLLDAAALVALEEIATLADLGGMATDAGTSRDRNRNAGSTTKEDDASRPDAVRYSRERYLIFTSGRRLAAPATQIRRIIKMPDDIVPLDARYRPVRGLFPVDGVSASLIDLAEWQGIAGSPAGPTHALLIAHDSGLFAFAVEGINGLASSEWRTDEDPDDPAAPDPVVHLAGEDRPVLPLMDFETILRSATAELADVPSQEPVSGA